MIRTQVYIPDDLHMELMLLAKREGVNFSTLIREGVREVVEKKKKRKSSTGWKKLIGAYKGNIKTNAAKDIHDYYLHGIVE